MSASPKTQVTVFSGFLGSGKSTILMHCMEQLKATGGADYQVCWLKNEYGDVAVDSRLAAEKNIQVKEMLQGCICCTQVGKLGDAIQEMLDAYHPDRILLETSGSSYPAPLARELRRLSESGMPIELDAIICVIDAVNFPGYADKSTTAKIQAKFTDLILINKHELVSPDALDRVMDDIFELNPDTPKLQTNKGFVDYRMLLGLDSKLLSQEDDSLSSAASSGHQDTDVHVLDLTVPADSPLPWSTWLSLLSTTSPENFYRIKGVVYLTEPQPMQNSVAVAAGAAPQPAPVAEPAAAAHVHDANCACGTQAESTDAATTTTASPPRYPHLLNYAFGRFDLTPLSSANATSATRVTFMGDAGMRMYLSHIRAALGLQDEQQLRAIVLPNSPTGIGAEAASA